MPWISIMARLHVSRVKGSEASTHLLSGRELRAWRRLKREQSPPSPFRVHIRARCAVCRSRLSHDGRAARRSRRVRVSSASASTASRLRLRASETKHRYAHVAGLSRPPQSVQEVRRGPCMGGVSVNQCRVKTVPGSVPVPMSASATIRNCARASPTAALRRVCSPCPL
jgi:hypothetical protein